MTIVAGPLNVPVFPHVGSDRDHRERLDARRKTAARLAADLAAQKFNVRGAYREILERYLEELPTEPGVGNFLLADCEARSLRGLFEEDAAFLPRELETQARSWPLARQSLKLKKLHQSPILRLTRRSLAIRFRALSTGRSLTPSPNAAFAILRD